MRIEQMVAVIKKMSACLWLFLPVLLIANGFLLAQSSVRIKDIVEIENESRQPLIGYGLVVGLNGTGDRVRRNGGSGHTVQSISNMLENFGITVPAFQIRTRNVAAVIVTGEAPAFGMSGARLDVTVSSVGDAKSLEGGILLMTPMKAPDGEYYALAQGAISVGGFNIETSARERIRKNYTSVGRVPGGARMVKDQPNNQIDIERPIYLQLSKPDYTTASRIASVINEYVRSDSALGIARSIAIPKSPEVVALQIEGLIDSSHQAIELLAAIEALQVVEDVEARVVMNERTGTIVAGGNVRIGEVMISHGNLKIHTRNRPVISQPGAFSSGQTVVQDVSETTVEEDLPTAEVIPSTTTVAELAEALNQLGVRPRDLISIFQAIQQAGALHAKLVIN